MRIAPAWNRTDGLRNQAWTLSAVNDWSSFTNNGTAVARTHGPTHEVLTVGTAAITHDSRGNMTTDEFAITRTYDWNNKVSQAVVPTGSVRGIVGTHDYQYDALGRRVRKTIGGGSPSDTVFVHLGQQIYADYTAGAAATSPDKKYVWGSYIDELVCQINGTTKYYIHRNQQYSTTSITAQSGTPAERYGYTSYGDLRTLNPNTLGIRTAPPMTRYTYTGREFDHECGTYHFRARIYSPTLGRFSSHDPILYPDGYNTYAGWFAISDTDAYGMAPPAPRNRRLERRLEESRRARIARYRLFIARVLSNLRGVSPCLQEATGLDDFADILENGSNCITDVGISDPATQSGNCLYFPPGTIDGDGTPGTIMDASDETIIHETIHAIDFRNGWNLGRWGLDDVQAAESLVYGAIEIINRIDLLNRGRTGCAGLKNTTNASGYSYFYPGFGARFVGVTTLVGGPSDLRQVSDRLGLRLDCNAIAQCLGCDECVCQ